MLRELTSLILEVLAILAAVGVLVAVLARWGDARPDVRQLAAGVVGGLALVIAVGVLFDSGAALNRARRAAVSKQAGLERCVREDGARRLLPFIRWVKASLPPRAVYQLVPSSVQLDAWCTTLVLLPSLLAGPGGTPTWTVTLGTIPPELQARIARRDPAVQVFGPGLTLARIGPG